MTGSDDKTEQRLTASAVAGSALLVTAAVAEGPLAIAGSILGGVLMFAPASRRNDGQPPSSWPEDDATGPPAVQPAASRQPATPSPAERWIDRAAQAATRRGRDI